MQIKQVQVVVTNKAQLTGRVGMLNKQLVKPFKFVM